MSLPDRPFADPAPSLLAPALLQAYRETDYTVCAQPAFVLRVGAPCPLLAAYFTQRGLNSACWLTAWNPSSELLDAAENQARQQALEAQLQQAGWHWLPAIAAHPHNGWPPEPGCFIEGMSVDTASDWGRRHGQNAVVCCGPDAVPRLVLLR
jgi:hypothetical protein